MLERADRPQVRIVGEFAEPDRRAVRNIGFLELIQQVFRLPAGDAFGDHDVEFADLLAAELGVRHPGIVDHLRALHQGKERPPMLGVIGQHAHETVRRRIRPPVFDHRALVARGAERRIECLSGRMLDHVEAGQGFEHRHLDHLPLARALAVE